MLVVEAARHAAAQLQPVPLELPHACLLCLAGRSALPLEPGDGGRRGMPREHQGQAVEPTKSAMDQLPSVLGSGAGLVGGALAAGGRACQHRPARSLHPGRGGRTRLPPRGPLAGPCQAISLVVLARLSGEPTLGAPGVVLGFLQDMRHERIAKFLLRQLIL
jgi:hypothetical protein